MYCKMISENIRKLLEVVTQLTALHRGTDLGALLQEHQRQPLAPSTAEPPRALKGIPWGAVLGRQGTEKARVPSKWGEEKKK